MEFNPTPKLRLLFVHERFGALGGAESNACITAAALAARGHQIGLIHGPNTGKEEAAWNEIFPIQFPLAADRAEEMVSLALRRFAPDLIYVHKMQDLCVVSALLASGKPLVRMVHDHDIYCMKSYKYATFSRRICTRPISWYCVFPCGAFVARNREGPGALKWVSYRDKQREVELNRRFDRLVVVSEYMRQELLRNQFDAAKVEIHPPVPKMGDATLRSSFSQRNLILFAGQIIRGKGVDVLLQALARVQTRFECVILGDGSHRATCERLSRKLGLSHRVTFRGFVPQNELKEFYRECNVVTLSSVWPEPIATIGLEAMRYALPVVAFDAGGIRDWLIDGHNGFLVPWMDRAQFAARVDQLLRDKQLARQMGERGHALGAERFGFEQYISNLEGMFHNVLDGRRSPGSRPPARVSGLSPTN